MILFKNKKIISFLVASILVLSFSVCAYADDDSGDTSTSPEDRLATQNELEDLDSRLMSTSELIFDTLSENGTKATTYTTTDIYNWLNNYLGTDFQNHGSTYPALMYARINSINTRLTSFNNLFSSWDTWINNISNNSTSIYLLLNELIDSINPDYQTVGISIYDLLHSISTALTSIDGDDGDLTLIETLIYMYNELEDINSTLSSLLNSSYSIDNRLVTIYTYLTSFRSDMNTGFTNVNANMATIINRLETINNSFNSLSWTTSTDFKIYDNYIDAFNLTDNYITENGTYSDIYISVSLSTNRLYSYIGYFNLSLYYTLSNNIKVTIPLANVEYDVPYYVNTKNNVTRLYLDLTYRNFQPFIIHIHSDNNFLYAGTQSQFFYYIDSSNIDYYYIYNQLTNISNNRVLNKFQLLYASDDLITAKENQQAYEDQAIEDFTGSGSASASISDLGGLKSVSSAFKSGLDSGGSVSNALSIFSNNSGFWGWFSQSNYNDINNLSNSGSTTRSGNNIQEDIIDFYSDNKLNLMYLLQNVGD